MRKISVLTLCLFVTYLSRAQSTTDTVSVGANYANQIWYSLENGVQTAAPKNNWDIAFDASSFGMTILINSVNGTMLWNYPHADTSGWETPDTSGIKTWTARWNADTSWASGAFDRYVDPANVYDAGWGIYNSLTHFVTGDSIFIIKLSDGSFKKIRIQLLAGGIYTFRYANLDGSENTQTEIIKSAYPGRNFIYYSLKNNTAVEREPASDTWDLVFGQYTAFIPLPYTVAGVLNNKKVSAVKVQGLADPEAYMNWTAHTFSAEINVIGYDWKRFVAGEYLFDDSTVYFVKDRQEAIWKLIFKGFGGSSNGNFIFTKEKINPASIKPNANGEMSGFTLFPNPASGERIRLIYHDAPDLQNHIINVYDLSGKKVHTENLNYLSDQNVYLLNLPILQPGLYIVGLESMGKRVLQKLLIR